MKSCIYLFLITCFFSNPIFGQQSAPVTSIDSLTQNKTEKVEIVNKSFDDLVKLQIQEENKETSIWDTIIPLLIGAGLTLITQFITDFSKDKKEKKAEILLAKGDLEKLKYLLKGNYKELAMHKAHKFYWYAHYEFENGKQNPDKNEVEKFYSSHMNSSSKARETENKIADNFAEYCKQVSKLQHLTEFNKKVNDFIIEYQNFTPQKPRDLITQNQGDLYDLEREEEDRLFNEYKHYITLLENINAEFK